MSRHDVVADYIGQKRIKTLKFIKENPDVIFIEPVCLGKDDPFGKEALEILQQHGFIVPQYIDNPEI